jgi:hypothetical protein
MLVWHSVGSCSGAGTSRTGREADWMIGRLELVTDLLLQWNVVADEQLSALRE